LSTGTIDARLFDTQIYIQKVGNLNMGWSADKGAVLGNPKVGKTSLLLHRRAARVNPMIEANCQARETRVDHPPKGTSYGSIHWQKNM
jgi:hypothetical protein